MLLAELRRSTSLTSYTLNAVATFMRAAVGPVATSPAAAPSLVDRRQQRRHVAGGRQRDRARSAHRTPRRSDRAAMSHVRPWVLPGSTPQSPRDLRLARVTPLGHQKDSAIIASWSYIFGKALRQTERRFHE